MDFNGGKLSEPDIFRVVFERNEISRSALAEIFSRVSPSTLYRLLDQMVRKGYLMEQIGASASNGRPPKIYSVNPASAKAVGISLSWDHIGIALVDIGGNVEGERYLAGASSLSPREAIVAITQECHGLIDACAAGSGAGIVGVGVAAFGPIQKEQGILSRGHHKLSERWDFVPLKYLLEAELKKPVIVDNLVTACLLNEIAKRRDLLGKSVTYVLLDKGIGSASYSTLKTETRRDLSGQLGHMTIDLRGELCVCGKRGCLETYASADAIGARLGGSIGFASGVDPSASLYEALSSYDTRLEDPAVRPVADQIEWALAAALLNYASIIAPDLLVLGGRTVDCMPTLVDKTIDAFRTNWRLTDESDPVAFEKAKLDDAVFLRGAAFASFNRYFGLFV